LKIRKFEWDQENLGHLIERHPDIEPEEVQEIFVSDPPPLIQRAKYGRYRTLGVTQHGRYLVVIFEYKGSGTIRPITARVMKPREKREYKKKRRS